MPEGRRINLEEGLGDSPQVRAEVSKFEKYLPPLKEYSTLLRDTFQACSIHQKKVCEGTDALSKLLTSFQSETMGDQETFIPKAFFRLSRYLSELHSCQEMLSSQLQNAVIELLSQFISNDFGNLEKLKENFETASQEHEQAINKFSRLSKKRDSEKTRFEGNAELFAARRKFYESTLDYHSELNCFQHKKKFAVMEPLLTFMHAQMAYFKVGHEILSRELGNLLTNLNTEVQRVHEDYQKELLTSANTRADIELRFPTLCLADPDPTDPFTDQPVVPNTSLTSKSGYLFIRTQTGFPSRWDRMYFFTKKGYLYIHVPPKNPELIINLKGAEAVTTESDDRRYVFMINHSSLKRPIYLLAESDLQKEEWMATINNIGSDRGQAQPRSNTKRDEAIIKLEREKIRSWVNNEIDPKKEKNSGGVLPKIPKTSPTPTPQTSASQLPSFPSLPSFLNFLDPSNQTNLEITASTSSTTAAPSANISASKKSPIFSRRASATPKATEQPVAVVEPTPHPPPALPSPLQPERLTAGGVATSRSSPHQHQQQHLGFSKTFFVKYLGHMEVGEGRNIAIITDTIQKVMSARVLRNVKEAQCIEMTVTNKSICLYDHNAKKAIGQILLRDILRCAVQPESTRLFGIVNRTTSDNSDKSKFICHVMEADTTGSQVCTAINEAIQAAVRIIQANKHARSKSSSTPVRQGHKDHISFSAAGSLRQVTPTSTSSGGFPSGLTPPTSSSLAPGKSPSKGTPKPHKSTSDSNLPSLMSSEFPRSSSVTSISSFSSSNSTDDVPALSTDYLPHPGPAPLQPSPASSQPSFVAMPPLVEQPNMGGQKGASNGAPPSLNGSALDQRAPLLPSVATSSLDYYQMPSTVQQGPGGQVRQGQSAGVSSETFSDGEMDSPLPPLDMFDAPSSGQVPDGIGGGAGGGVALAGGGSSVDSGYFQMPSSLGSANAAADTSSNQQPPPLFGGGSGLPDSGSASSSYLSSDVPGSTSNNNNDVGAGLFGDTPLEGAELSSSDNIFNVSSSQDGGMFPLINGGGSEIEASSTNSGYLPAPGSSLDVLNQQSATAGATTMTNNVSSSSFGGSFPGMAAPGGGEGDLDDDFDLPPLPDSMDQPGAGQVGVAGYGSGGGGGGAMGYGGSMVTLGTPKSQQN